MVATAGTSPPALKSVASMTRKAICGRKTSRRRSRERRLPAALFNPRCDRCCVQHVAQTWCSTRHAALDHKLMFWHGSRVHLLANISYLDLAIPPGARVQLIRVGKQVVESDFQYRLTSSSRLHRRFETQGSLSIRCSWPPWLAVSLAQGFKHQASCILTLGRRSRRWPGTCRCSALNTLRRPVCEGTAGTCTQILGLYTAVAC